MKCFLGISVITFPLRFFSPSQIIYFLACNKDSIKVDLEGQRTLSLKKVKIIERHTAVSKTLKRSPVMKFTCSVTLPITSE